MAATTLLSKSILPAALIITIATVGRSTPTPSTLTQVARSHVEPSSVVNLACAQTEVEPTRDPFAQTRLPFSEQPIVLETSEVEPPVRKRSTKKRSRRGDSIPKQTAATVTSLLSGRGLSPKPHHAKLDDPSSPEPNPQPIIPLGSQAELEQSIELPGHELVVVPEPSIAPGPVQEQPKRTRPQQDPPKGLEIPGYKDLVVESNN